MNSIDCQLVSGPMIHAPTIFRYAQHGYKTSRKKAEKKKFVNLLMAWEHPMMTESIAEALLSGKIETVSNWDEGTVGFVINEAN